MPGVNEINSNVNYTPYNVGKGVRKVNKSKTEKPEILSFDKSQKDTLKIHNQASTRITDPLQILPVFGATERDLERLSCRVSEQQAADIEENFMTYFA